jgi:hypothetical protein
MNLLNLRRQRVALLVRENHFHLARCRRKGELRQKYQEGQEDQLGALGLVVNMIVLWNTMYISKAIDHLKATGMEIRDEDIRRVTPLGFKHIRFLGRYDFTLRVKPERGGLRPLQQKRTP